MEVVYNDETLKEYMQLAVGLATNHPVLIDKYIEGKEVEVDGICDGEDVLIPGIMEHIEERVFTPETVFQYILPRLLTMKQRIPLWIIP